MVGRGCFVSELSQRELLDIRDETIDEKLSKDLEYYRELGLSANEIIRKIRQLF
jgi:DNA-binding transcriptional regulator YhcF (GntR family)